MIKDASLSEVCGFMIVLYRLQKPRVYAKPSGFMVYCTCFHEERSKCYRTTIEQRGRQKKP